MSTPSCRVRSRSHEVRTLPDEDPPSNTPQETVEIIEGTPPANMWSPSIGSEVRGLLARLRIPEAEKQQLLREAVEVMRRCVGPAAREGQKTGLVLGHVQSGKTMSFTTVAALARDNGYKLFIVIAGTSTLLYDQSRARLVNDLDLELRTRHDRKWQLFPNPTPNELPEVQAALAEWANPHVLEDQKQSILIVVMKHHTHLRNLIALLSRLDLNSTPAIIVDDEADQAGLNTNPGDGMSTTYSRLIALRSSLPVHTYLQYTATPQALLLINIIDTLAPDFAELLTPGAAYVGGEEVFITRVPDIVKVVPSAEIPSKDHPLNAPPPTLLEALRLFYLGVAAGLAKPEQGGRNRSMMIHPSQLTVKHAQYHNWVRSVQALWAEILQGGSAAPEYSELIGDFRQSWADISATVEGLPAFEELARVLPSAVSKTRITKVNTAGGQTPRIEWARTYSNILVGGQAMDRGFTVEGLTVTYMPRGIGTGTADSIQQRARFLGYKGDYLGFCRIYLDPDSAHAYTDYVEHENDIHDQLTKHRGTGKSLDEWKRAFILDPALSPTRDKVIDVGWVRGVFSDDWFWPKAPQEAVESNRAVVEQFLGGLEWHEDSGHADRTEMQKHLVSGAVPLSDALKGLLLPMRMPRLADSERYYGLLLQLTRQLQDVPDEECVIYQMSKGANRKRTLNDVGEIPTIPQGPDPEKDGSIYPGDTRIRDPARVSIQIHDLRVVSLDGQNAVEHVKAVAVWVPNRFARFWVSQPQGGP